MYPIGSIYLSTSGTNPANHFGGTWVMWGQVLVPVSVSTSGTCNGVEKTGGVETHSLIEMQMPPHAGYVPNSSYYWGSAGENTYMLPASSGYQVGTNRPFVARAGNELCIRSNPAGGGESHNNLQPYITCYMWKITA